MIQTVGRQAQKGTNVLFYALQCAKSDRLAFADAVGDDSPEYEKALADVRAFELLQRRVFGTTKGKLDRILENAGSVSVYDIRRLLDAEPELFIHADDCECDYCRPTTPAPDQPSAGG